jgi:putative polyhydroxyalkanoate system protein
MRIRRSHELGMDEARKRADRIAKDLSDEYGVRAEWEGDHMVVRGSGINGQLLVAEQFIELQVKLGFAMRLMEAPIRAVIEKTIDDELA